MLPLISAFGAFVFIALLVKHLNKTDIPKIKNLPELPGMPMFGSLFLLGKYHARNCARLAEKFGPVFQVRLGNRRIIYANSFDAVKELWITQQSSLNSRPTFWTFHSVVSKTQGAFTIGTSPWSDSLKRLRKVAATALNRQATMGYLPFIDLESTTSINELFQNALQFGGEIDPNGYFQRFSLNISLTLTYGMRIEGTVSDKLLNEIVEVERELGYMRGVAHNWQDYVPLLRLLTNKKKRAIGYRTRRDEYILSFWNDLKQKIADGTDKPCIVGNVVKDPDTKLDEHEIRCICLTMVAAGLDTLPGNINMTVAYLSSPHGQEIQERAYEEIIKAHEGEDPWHGCVLDEKSEYMRSFIKETLRFWSTLNMSFTRQSTKDINYNGATIPANTPFFMNMWAANHDPTHFKSPMELVPDRFMGISEAGAGTQHFAFGAGSRMCTGVHLANRQFYTIFTRLILAFRFLPTSDPKSAPILDSIDCNAVPTSMFMQPKPFKVNFQPRNPEQLRKWTQESFDATAHL